MPSTPRHARLCAGLAACIVLAPLAAAAPAAPIVVRVAPAESLLLPSSRSAAAAVLSPNDAVIAAEITAPVAKIAADVGASVERGALLANLDCTDQTLAAAQARAQRDAAEARVALAVQRLERGRALSAKSFVSEDELLALATEQRAVQAAARVTEAQQAIADRQVAKCRIEAPFDAVVLERRAQVGMLATPGTPLFRLVDRAAPEVEANVPASEADGLGNATSITLDLQGRRHPLQLLRLSPVIDPQARTRVARFGFAGAPAAAGASGSVQWQTRAGRLPAELLVQRDGQLGVFVADGGSARFVPIPTALPGRPADVDQAPGALIVVEGQQGLNDGDPIQLRGD